MVSSIDCFISQIGLFVVYSKICKKFVNKGFQILVHLRPVNVYLLLCPFASIRIPKNLLNQLSFQYEFKYNKQITLRGTKNLGFLFLARKYFSVSIYLVISLNEHILEIMLLHSNRRFFKLSLLHSIYRRAIRLNVNPTTFAKISNPFFKSSHSSFYHSY